MSDSLRDITWAGTACGASDVYFSAHCTARGCEPPLITPHFVTEIINYLTTHSNHLYTLSK